MGLLEKLFGPPSRGRFAQLVMRQFRTAGATDEFEYDSEQFRLVAESGRTVNLGNFYHQHCQLPRAHRKAHIQQIVIAMLHEVDLPEDFEDASHDIRPRMWSRAAFQHMTYQQRMQGEGPEPDIAGYPIGEHLFCSVVFDLPNSVRTLSNEDLDRWDVTVYEALEVGRQQLEEDTTQYAKIGDGFYSFIHGDTYDASRLVLIDRIRELEVDGFHVAVVPNRECLLVTGSDDEEGLKMMAELTEKSLADPYPLIPHPLRLDGDTWTEWMPPEDHPAFPKFKYLVTGFLHNEYDQQKSILEQLFEQEGRDIFVASFTAVANEDDELFTYSVWSEGVDTMLPHTDLVMFFREGQEVIASGRWDDVAIIVGDLLEPIEDCYPQRFRTRGFPHDDQLERIGNAHAPG